MTTGHGEALAALGVSDEARAPLARYLDLVERWSRRVNLTAARTATARADTLVRDAWSCADWVEGPDLVDIGSGAGTPGLVLALLRPELRVTLLEPRQKRWAFLREACRALGRPDIRVEAWRHTDWSGPGAQTVTIRALRLPLGELAALSAPGGLLVAIGRAPAATGPFRGEAGGPGGAIHLYRHR